MLFKGVLIIRRVNDVSLFRRVLVEVNTRGTNMTYTEIKVSVKELEGVLLIHGAHAKVVPFVSNAHGP